jgi:hypothetical protein
MMCCMLLGPSILWIWELVNWGYQATLECHPFFLAGGKW